MGRKKEAHTIAVDIDGTLCVETGEWWRYESLDPITKNIESVNKLYEQGNQIVIYTARFEEDRQETETWLKKYGVKYHRLVMGKFRADIYIDSAMMKPEDLL